MRIGLATREVFLFSLPNTRMQKTLIIPGALFALALSSVALADDDAKPIRALYLAGGCCHDYAKQKDVIKAGLEARAKIVVDVVYSPDTTTRPPMPFFGKPDYAKGYDVVIHHECAADIQDPAIIDAVLKPHREDHIPGVNLHCAMHCYRFGNYGKPVAADADNGHWYEYLGLQSTGHGPQEPIEISFTDNQHPITKGLLGWTTGKEEHYNNIQVFPTAHILGRGKQITRNKDGTEKVNDFVNVWTNEYHGTHVFSTTLMHNTAAIADERYLDLVTRGVLWACNKLNNDYLKATPRP